MNPFAYPCPSVREIPEGHDSRLCKCSKAEWVLHDDNALRELTHLIQDSDQKHKARAKPVDPTMSKSAATFASTLADWKNLWRKTNQAPIKPPSKKKRK
jgi:hypothetical protein